MPGGFLKKFGTASCGITAILVTVARVWAGRRESVATSAAASASPLNTSFFIDSPLRNLRLQWLHANGSECSRFAGHRRPPNPPCTLPRVGVIARQFIASVAPSFARVRPAPEQQLGRGRLSAGNGRPRRTRINFCYFAPFAV